MISYKLLSSLYPSDDGRTVTIPVPLFQHLLRLALATGQINEEEYLRKNPDVAAAIRSGDIANAQDHFISAGYFEDRGGVGLDVSESWYVKSNPDVARAIVMGEWVSGEAHYNQRGLFEGRAPNKAAEPDLAVWKEVLQIPAQANPRLR